MNEKATESSQANFESDLICSITQFYFYFSVITPCGHTFEKEAIERWVNDREKNCPLCKRPLELSDIKEDRQKIEETEKHLFSNISKLPERYVPQSLISAFSNEILGNKNLAEAFSLFQKNLHLIFFADKKINVLWMILNLPFENFKEFIGEINKIEGFLEIVFSKVLPESNLVGANYIFQIGDIDKFDYIRMLLKDDFTLFEKSKSCLHLTAKTKNHDFFNHVLNNLKDKTKEYLFLLDSNSRNVLMIACESSTLSIVSCLLEELNKLSMEEILQILSNPHNPSIFYFITYNTSTEAFSIYSKMNEFIDEKFGDKALEFKQYMQFRLDGISQHRMDTKINHTLNTIYNNLHFDLKNLQSQVGYLQSEMYSLQEQVDSFLDAQANAPTRITSPSLQELQRANAPTRLGTPSYNEPPPADIFSLFFPSASTKQSVPDYFTLGIFAKDNNEVPEESHDQQEKGYEK